MKRRRSTTCLFLGAPLLLACGPFFYQAPPPLAAYPQRVPGRGWADIMAESHPMKPGAAMPLSLLADCRELIGQFPTLTAEKRLKRIAALIDRNREENFSAGIANLLLEMQELASDEPHLTDSTAYLQGRAVDALGGGLPNFLHEPEKDWSETPEQFAKRQQEFSAQLTQARTDADALLATSGPEYLLPNRRVRHAASLMSFGDFDQAAAEFAAVIKDSPTQLRAEVAAFMLGRCHLAHYRWQKAKAKPAEIVPAKHASDPRSLATAAFQNYLTAYPTGRFTSDALGWLGAVEVENGRPGAAIGWQIDRLAKRASRETLRSVLRGCEDLYGEMIAECYSIREGQPHTPADDEALAATIPWKKVAQCPEVAHLLVALSMDPGMRNSLPGDQWYEEESELLDMLHRRILKPDAFTRRSMQLLSEAIAAEHAAPNQADAFAQEILGWCALKEGKAEQALALFDGALKAAKRDELLQGRAMALAALGRHRESLESQEALSKDSPDHEISQASAYNRAVETLLSGDVTGALLAIHRHDTTEQRNGGENYSPDADPLPVWPAPPSILHPDSEWMQLGDTLLNFSPLEPQLAALQQLQQDDPELPKLRASMRGRALAEGRFDLAKLCLDASGSPEEEQKKAQEDSLTWGVGAAAFTPLSMTSSRWDKEIQPLEDLGKKLQEATGSEAAKLELELANRWRDLRGRVFLRSGEPFYFAADQREKLDQIRRQNASFIGLSAEAATEILDTQDELVHALRYYLAAAEGSHDPEIAAPALEGANEALFRLAETSLYRLDRALEQDHTALSAKLVYRLKKEFPHRPEAVRAVTYSFRQMPEDAEWMPGDYSPWNSAASMEMEVTAPEEAKSGSYYGDNDSPWLKADSKVAMLALLTKGDLAEIRSNLAAATAQFELSHATMEKSEIYRMGALLDDLTAAASLPGITQELYSRYYRYRNGSDAVGKVDDQEWSLLKPILEYRKLADDLAHDHQFGEQRWDIAAAWEKYLADYPNGPKTEAARFQWLRAQVYRISPVPQVRAFAFPAAPIPAGYKRLQFLPDQPLAEAGNDEITRLSSFIETLGTLRAETMEEAAAMPQDSPEKGKLVAKAMATAEAETKAREKLGQLQTMDTATRQKAAQAELKTLRKELALYGEVYPHGRYRADYLLMRSSLWADSGDYQTALHDLAGILTDQTRPELHMDAVLRFAEISQRLLNPDQRVAVAQALRKQPAAMEVLKSLVDGDTCLSRLKPLVDWVERG